MNSYKHALSLTSQVPFCSVPLRLDAYDRCQFACSYCFAKARGGNRGTEAVAAASTSAIKMRMSRVAKGYTASALDEMLAKRVPIQFGGMTDPFSALEEREGIALGLLRLLADFNYPTLISTKSTLLGAADYLNVLRQGNFYVRMSFTGASAADAAKLERGVAGIEERLQTAERLSQAGIPTSARLQPLIPGQEVEAAKTILEFARRGIKHVSVEYLKWPLENAQHQNRLLRDALPGMCELYNSLGARRVGREFVLPSEYKIRPLLDLAQVAADARLVFGFADNDLLHLNDFNACCNAADLFLQDAHFFDANILAAVKNGINTGFMQFSDVKRGWLPSASINNYLNSRSRPFRSLLAADREWHAYLQDKWNGPVIRGGPSSFWGCERTDERDDDSNVIYRASPELIELARGRLHNVL